MLDKLEMIAPQAGGEIATRDVTVIIRSAGERTKDWCYRLLCDQVPAENIVVIKERPFTKTIRRCFEVGIECGRPWTVCIDADVLLRRSGIRQLLELAHKTHDNVFQVQGDVIDKFFDGPRPAGNRLYRTALFGKALKYIPDCKSAIVRPESFVVKQMASQGYPFVKEKVVVGIHDFEQYYRDIYRKAFVHAHKHATELRKYIEPLWRRMAEQDPDYQVALWGLRAGRIFDGTVQLDVQRFPQDLDGILTVQGWQEKSELELPHILKWDVDRFIDKFIPSSEYWSWKLPAETLEAATTRSRLRLGFHQMLTRTGWMRTGPWLVGKGLQGVGNRLRKWAER